jgi:hypothetical protein
MDDRGANIDLLFRNGLKDYEVLPPPEVWNNIQPAVKGTGPFIFLRAAALIAAVTTISVVAWMMSRDAALNSLNPSSALNIGRMEPLHAPLLSVNSPEVEVYTFVPPVIEIPPDSDLLPAVESESLSPLPSTSSFSLRMPESRFSDGMPSFTASETATQTDEAGFSLEIPVFTNEPDVAPQVKERWSISALASPTYYSRFGSTDPVQVATEQSSGSYSGGLSVAYRINRRLSIQTGLFYASLGQHIEGINSFAGFQQYSQTKGGHNFELATSSGTLVTNNADVFLIADGNQRLYTQYTRDVFDPVKADLRYVDNSIIQNFSYLQMPVMLRYKLVDRNLALNLIGGIASDVLVGNSAFAHEGGSKYRIGETEGLNTLAFSSSLGMGFEYNFSQKISLNLEPTFRYFINPFHSAPGTKIYPYSFGVFSGFSYKF